MLVDALNGLERLAEELPAENKVALIIDEFQEILIQSGATAEKQIRSAIQTHKNTAYIFAGSKTRMLTEMTTDPSRPFYRLGKLLFIGELPRPEFARFLIDKFTLGDFFAPKIEATEKVELAHHLLDTAQDVPYNVQMLAHTLWNHLLQIKVGAPEKAVLSYRLRGKNIYEVLHLSVSEANDFFEEKEICPTLERMIEVGLEYITLGQPLSTFSGGEKQRLKLAVELEKFGQIYVFDEPTTGLHMADIERFVALLNRLVDKGSTVIVIEHNLDVVSQADWVIDMGPEAGHEGGEVIFTGRPSELIKNKNSVTGVFLNRYINDRGRTFRGQLE